jgi:hypothetical protein
MFNVFLTHRVVLRKCDPIHAIGYACMCPHEVQLIPKTYHLIPGLRVDKARKLVLFDSVLVSIGCRMEIHPSNRYGVDIHSCVHWNYTTHTRQEDWFRM